MALGKYLVFHGRAVRATSGLESVAFAGLYARNYEAAQKIAAELFPNQPITVEHYKLKSGWTDNGDLFIVYEGRHGPNIRGSRYRGVQYVCKVCGKKNLGRGSHNHWAWCPYNERGQ